MKVILRFLLGEVSDAQRPDNRADGKSEVMAPQLACYAGF